MKVGSLVEYVDNRPGLWSHICPMLVIGEIYTIRGFNPHPMCPDSVFLEEIIGARWPTDPAYEIGYSISRFREVQPPMKISIDELLKELA